MIVLAATLFVIAGASQQAPACDVSAIRWVLPGNFQTAQKQSKTEKRLIAIKGIAFGVDQEGATCGTKGKW